MELGSGGKERNRSVIFNLGDIEEADSNDALYPLLPQPRHHDVVTKPGVHEMFIELYDLTFGHGGEAEWQETARWIKYEEDAEGLDHHWGRPHVAFLSFHALLQLRKCVTKGIVSLDLQAHSYSDVCNHIVEEMATKFHMDEDRIKVLINSLHKKHKHVHEGHHVHLPRIGSTIAAKMSTIEEGSRENSTGGSTVKMNGDKKSKTVPTTFTIEEPEETEAAQDTNPPEQGAQESQADTVDCSPRAIVRQHSKQFLGRERDASVTRPRDVSFIRRMGSRSRLSSFMGSKRPSFLSLTSDEKDTGELLRIVPENAEAAQVFVGVLEELKGARFAMVRLARAVEMPELLEAPIPVKFLFVILGPNLLDIDYHELGRSISTLMSNPHFHEIAYQAESRDDLIDGIDEFLDESIVVPPGEIDNKQLLSPDQIKKALKKRKRKRSEALDKIKQQQLKEKGEGEEVEEKEKEQIPTILKKQAAHNPLKRTGRLFGGVIRDIKYRLPYYASDFQDGLNFQCLTSVVFMFFAAFAPAITFGGLMGNYTRDAMGITETLIAQCICGIIWGIFSAQPMLIMSPTGPVLIFEASLYVFCQNLGLDFLVVRVYAGIWLFLIAVLTVMFEGSFLVSYVTRFTEDIFAVLISAIFISESIKFMKTTFKRHPVMQLPWYKRQYFGCLRENEEERLDKHLLDLGLKQHWGNASELEKEFTLRSWNESVLPGTEFEGCDMYHQPDTALLTIILLLATFLLAYMLKKLRTSYFLSRTLRSAIGDFGVLIAIVIVSAFDVMVFTKPFLRRLDMPDSFGFTNATARGGEGVLLISFDLIDKWWQGILFALVPALLVYILLFVETEITELLLTNKERGLRKGSGFHWDLLLVGALALLCSMLGLPWMCAAAVQSLAHASSLTVMKRHAPGERASVDFVVEQRVTTIGVSVLIGACAFAGKVLKLLPLCVLFGVFLYLGVMNLVGVQFLNRIILLFIPEKYFPDVPYCQDVKMWRMHLYTGIQMVALVGVYIVKSFKTSSLAFPFVLMFTAVIRMFVLPKIFSDDEIKALDGHDEDEEELDEVDLYEEARGLGM